MGLFSSGGGYNRVGTAYGKNGVGITASCSNKALYNVNNTELWIKVNYYDSGEGNQLILIVTAGKENIIIKGADNSHSMISTITGTNISGSISTSIASIDEFLIHVKSDLTAGIS